LRAQFDAARLRGSARRRAATRLGSTPRGYAARLDATRLGERVHCVHLFALAVRTVINAEGRCVHQPCDPLGDGHGFAHSDHGRTASTTGQGVDHRTEWRRPGGASTTGRGVDHGARGTDACDTVP